MDIPERKVRVITVYVDPKYFIKSFNKDTTSSNTHDSDKLITKHSKEPQNANHIIHTRKNI
jgi:hypothetical protein